MKAAPPTVKPQELDSHVKWKRPEEAAAATSSPSWANPRQRRWLASAAEIAATCGRNWRRDWGCYRRSDRRIDRLLPAPAL